MFQTEKVILFLFKESYLVELDLILKYRLETKLFLGGVFKFLWRTWIGRKSQYYIY